MKKQLILFCLSFSFIVNGFSQNPGEWMWLGGSMTCCATGNYGTKGVSSPANIPRALYEACEWKDLYGNLWLYGGIEMNRGAHNDLLKYNPVTKEWTWMSGSKSVDAPGSLGTQGVSSPSNFPPSIGWGVSTWVDLTGNLWLFGGAIDGGSTYSDLWKYDIATNEWTWMKGPGVPNSPGVYGFQGVPSITNYPPARSESAASWTDNAGNLWLFGGAWYNGNDPLNDLWRYNIATNTWTWMKGSSLPGQFGNYGTKKVESSFSTPGGRWVYAKWKDRKGNFWLWGGYGKPHSGGSSLWYLADLWRYNLSTNSWTWMSGDSTANAFGTYGTKCQPDLSNSPGSRGENRTAWTDDCGNFWMFGGGQGGALEKLWNDLWMYCPASDQWTWMSNDNYYNPAGDYGTLGVSSPTNKPPFGRGGAVPWTVKQDHLWFFGGSIGNGTNAIKPMNDLWSFTINSGCGTCATIPKPDFVYSDTVVCNEGGKCIDFTDFSTCNPTTWEWHFPGAIPDTSSLRNPSGICYSSSGTYTVKLIVSSPAGADSLIVSPAITIGQNPAAPVLTSINDTIFCSNPGVYSYQWYFNGSPVASAIDSFIVITGDGNYTVKITTQSGCSSLSTPFIITSTKETENNRIKIVPNPSNGTFMIKSGDNILNGELTICNVIGEKVYAEPFSGKQKIIQCQLAPGIYFLRIKNQSGEWVSRAVIQ